jgi:hypothetical protein
MQSTAGDELVGRASLLADISGWLTPALAGRGRTVLLTGEPGIGKSTLVEAVCTGATGAGFLVGRGWCSEAGMPAYWPWRRALAGLSPRLRFGVGAGEPDERAVLLAAVVEALEDAGRQQPLLIAIDDLHWADASSLLLLRTVVEAVPTPAVAAVLTVGDDPLAVNEATRAAIADLPTAVRRVPMPPLDRASAATLVRRFGGRSVPEAAVAAVVDRTGGNPFFVTEVARLLATHGPDGAMVVPPGVREAVQRRLARLPQACHAVLTAAAVAAESATGQQDTVDTALLAAAAAVDESTVLERLEPAVRGSLVVLDPSRAVGVRFVHALVREALVEATSLAERGRLHRRVAEALADRAGSATPPDEVAARAAYHWSRADGPNAARQAGRWELEAADAAVRALGFEAAAAHLQRAADAPGVDRIAVLIRLGEVQRLAGELPSARATFMAAAELAAEANRGAEMAAAALGLGGGITGFEVPIASADLSGDGTVTVAALAAWCDASAGPDFVEQRLAAAQRMTGLAQDRVSLLLARRLSLVAHLERGDLTTVDAEIAAYDRVAEAVGVALYRWLPAVWHGMRALLREIWRRRSASRTPPSGSGPRPAARTRQSWCSPCGCRPT